MRPNSSKESSPLCPWIYGSGLLGVDLVNAVEKLGTELLTWTGPFCHDTIMSSNAPCASARPPPLCPPLPATFLCFVHSIRYSKVGLNVLHISRIDTPIRGETRLIWPRSVCSQKRYRHHQRKISLNGLVTGVRNPQPVPPCCRRCWVTLSLGGTFW